MVAMVEINLEQNIPQWLFIVFSVMTTILISVHVFALMISTCILPNIETVDQLNSHTDHFESVIGTLACDSPHM